MVRRPRDLDSIFGDDGSPIISDTELNEIQISELKPYPGHGFKLYSDIRMQKLTQLGYYSLSLHMSRMESCFCLQGIIE